MMDDTLQPFILSIVEFHPIFFLHQGFIFFWGF
jgi:hypothetical protein